MRLLIVSSILLLSLFGCSSFVTTPPSPVGHITAYYDSSKKKEEPALSMVECIVSKQISTGYPTVGIFSREKMVGIELQIENAIIFRDELVKVNSGEIDISKFKAVFDKGRWHVAGYSPLKAGNGESTFMIMSFGVAPIFFSERQIPQLIEILNNFIAENPKKK